MTRAVRRGPPGPRQRAKMARDKAAVHRARGDERGIVIAMLLEEYADHADREADERAACERTWSAYLRALTRRKDV